MDGSCLSQGRHGWALSQLACTANSCQYAPHPTCQPRAGFSVGHDKVFNVRPGCLTLRISLRESQFLGHEMFSKGQIEALGAIFRLPSACAYITQDKKPMSDSHYLDLCTLNHQYREVPTVPSRKFGDFLTTFRFCGS